MPGTQSEGRKATMMRRRAVFAALATQGVAGAQGQGQAQGRLPRRIGFLHSSPLDGTLNTLRILRGQWRRLGYVEGESVLLRSAQGDLTRLPALVTELLARDVSVIIAVGAHALRAAAAGTRSTAIVGIDLETNPVATGLAQSLARPGGHVTGLFLDQPSIAGKWLELLEQVRPGLRRVVLLWDPGTGPVQREAAEAKAASLGLAAVVLDWRAMVEPRAALAPFADGTTGLVTLTAPGFGPVARALGEAALANGLPMLVFLRNFLLGGALLSYGPDQEAFLSRAMVFVERILAGARPGDLPIELPVRYQLALDLRVARGLGLAIPMALLAQADEVIE